MLQQKVYAEKHMENSSEEQSATKKDNADVVARTGFFPLVVGNEVKIAQAGSTVAVSKGALALNQGGAQVMLVGGTASINQGGTQTLVANGDVSINQGGALVAAAKSIQTERSYVGLALGRDVTLNDSKVLFDPLAAAAFGVAAGVVAAVLRRVLGRR